MSAEAHEDKLVKKCASYLRSVYGEELVQHEILDNSVDDGDGELVMNCVVRVGGSKSRWQKTFTFDGGDVIDMTWRFLG